MSLQEEETPTSLVKFVPILTWLPRYQRSWLRIDLVAGLTASAVVIPLAMEAYQRMQSDSQEFGLSGDNLTNGS
jgi:MFS superfamily sulfate permease-like transporter